MLPILLGNALQCAQFALNVVQAKLFWNPLILLQVCKQGHRLNVCADQLHVVFSCALCRCGLLADQTLQTIPNLCVLALLVLLACNEFGQTALDLLVVLLFALQVLITEIDFGKFKLFYVNSLQIQLVVLHIVDSYSSCALNLLELGIEKPCLPLEVLLGEEEAAETSCVLCLLVVQQKAQKVG